jgi:hypothetical protein
MKKALLTGIAALFLATGTVHAEPHSCAKYSGVKLQQCIIEDAWRKAVEPPEEFDHEFIGTMTVTCVPEI